MSSEPKKIPGYFSQLFAGLLVLGSIKPAAGLAQRAMRDSSVITLRGKVLDQNTHNGVAAASVLIKGSGTGAVADQDGNFQLKIPADRNHRTSFLISSLGYLSKEFPVREFSRRDTDSFFLAKSQEVLGGITIIEPKRKWWQFLK